MIKLKRFIREELYGWSKKEIIWAGTAMTVILVLSLYWKDSVIGIFAALTGVACVILTGKGKISSYAFGTVNTIFYAYVAFGAKYYGEVMLNLLYYLPMNFVGWYMWKRHMNHETQEVIKDRLTVKWQLLVGAACAVCVVGYGLILGRMGGSLPFVDSLSVVVAVIAQILCVKRYMEQWVLWIIVDAVSVFMWIAAFFNGGESVASLLMWSVYLLNAIFMFVKWYRESGKNTAVQGEINV
ncbi:MAG: nicotinamide mononucleotide transporter [Clostridiales bacterium]|nr:nicotinamide mononucleotide transporter [Clostridiales bacterium]